MSDESTFEVTTDLPRYSRIPLALLADPDLSAAAKLVFAGLESFTHQRAETCWPSRATLAARVGVAPRSVQRPIAELAAAGWVTVTVRHRSDGGRSTNSYRLHFAQKCAGGQDESRAVPPARDRADKKQRSSEAEKELPLAPPSRPSEPKPPTTGERARALLKTEWDTRDPKPAGSFMGAAKMVERCLDGGWPERLVAEALRRTVVFTGNGMDAARAQIERERGGGQRRGGPASTERPWMRR